MSKALKTQIVGELKERFKDVNCCVLLKFEGLEVEKAHDFRSHLRGENIACTVVKDSLAKIVFKELNLPAAEEFFIGPTAIAFGGADTVAAPKAVSDWILREGKKMLVIKGGVADGRLLDAAQVKELASIPPRPQMLSLVLSVVIGPAAAVMNLSQALQVKVSGLVQALIEKKEKD